MTLAFIAPLVVVPVVADAAGPREHHGAWTVAADAREHHGAWTVAADAAGPREHHGTWQQGPIVLSLLLGLDTEAGDSEIVPSKLMLQAETPYKLVIINPSEVAHVLTLPEFSTTVKHSSAPAFPYKPGRIDVAAGETMEWYFVPTKTGHYKMGCAIRAHAEAGMHGEIVVN
jgi:plastocyanin